MEKLYTNIIGTFVMEHDSIRPLTTVKDIVLDPERGKLIALVVNINKNLIIAPIDIEAWSDVIRVHSGNVIVEAKEVLRVAEVQKNKTRFIDNRVETEEGKSLGKVFNLALDSNTFDLKKIFVAKSLLGLFRYETRIISAKNIIEVLPDKIIVKNGLKTVKEEAKEDIRVKDMAVG